MTKDKKTTREPHLLSKKLGELCSSPLCVAFVVVLLPLFLFVLYGLLVCSGNLTYPDGWNVAIKTTIFLGLIFVPSIIILIFSLLNTKAKIAIAALYATFVTLGIATKLFNVYAFFVTAALHDFLGLRHCF